MNISQCSQKLRELSKAHANYQLATPLYLQERKQLLDALDQSLNGVSAYQVAPQVPQATLEQQQIADSDPDKTQPYFVGKLNKCMNFIKGDNKN